MSEANSETWVDATRDTVHAYRRMIDAIVGQLNDEELTRRPAAGINSVAVLLRHLAGNLRSRWTDFLNSDGEKPDRNRDTEFSDWEGTRQSLMEYFDSGWECLVDAIETLKTEDAQRTITIRGESHALADAVLRSITHIAYHVGQMALVARMVHAGEWRWLTIPPGKSAEYNSQTWGSAASRGVFADEENPK